MQPARLPAIIAILELIVCLSYGQTTIDSLKNVLDHSQDDSTTVFLKLQLAQELYNIDLKESLSYAQEALELAQYKHLNAGIQSSLSMLSRVHRRLGNFSVAIEYNLQQVDIAEQRNDTAGVIDAYTTLGNIYSSLNNYPESKRNLFEAFRLGEKVSAPSLSAIMNFIGRNYGKMKMYDSAKYWISQALEYELNHPQPGYALSYIYNNLAEVYLAEKNYGASLTYYDISRNLPENKRSPFGLTFTLNGMAGIYLATGKYQEAIQALNQSLGISRKYGYRDKTRESYGILHEVYERMGDYKNALLNYKQFHIYQDSIFSEDRMQYIDNLKINHETEKVASENALLKKDAELKDAHIAQQKSYTILWITLAILISGAFAFLYYIYQQNKKRSKLLSDYNTNLETKVEERTQELVRSNLELIRQNNQLEQFGYITAHNLRAPVARILGLTNIIDIQNKNPEEEKFILEKLKDTAEELDTIIHDMNAILDIKKGAQHAFEVVDFHERILKIRSVLKDSIISTQTEIEEDFSAVKSCFAIPAYLESILYNLISNAIKYRSPERKPKIKIKSRLHANNLELIVTDNGIGFNLEQLRDKVFNLYQRFHSHVEGKGIGLFLVKTQVEAMNGSVEIESQVDAGTTFRISIPLKIVNT